MFSEDLRYRLQAKWKNGYSFALIIQNRTLMAPNVLEDDVEVKWAL